jgi:hypothetical protein
MRDRDCRAEAVAERAELVREIEKELLEASGCLSGRIGLKAMTASRGCWACSDRSPSKRRAGSV